VGRVERFSREAARVLGLFTLNLHTTCAWQNAKGRMQNAECSLAGHDESVPRGRRSKEGGAAGSTDWKAEARASIIRRIARVIFRFCPRSKRAKRSKFLSRSFILWSVCSFIRSFFRFMAYSRVAYGYKRKNQCHRTFSIYFDFLCQQP